MTRGHRFPSRCALGWRRSPPLLTSGSPRASPREAPPAGHAVESLSSFRGSSDSTPTGTGRQSPDMTANNTRRRFLPRPERTVVAIRLPRDANALVYRKWGGEQRAKPGDWLVDNDGDVYTVDAE